MKDARALWVSALFVLIAGMVALWLYPSWPARVPSHWNLAGQVTRDMPRLWAALLPASMIALLALLMVAMPAIAIPSLACEC